MTILAITPIHTEFQALTQALLARGLPSRARLVGRMSGLEYSAGDCMSRRVAWARRSSASRRSTSSITSTASGSWCVQEPPGAS